MKNQFNMTAKTAFCWRFATDHYTVKESIEYLALYGFMSDCEYKKYRDMVDYCYCSSVCANIIDEDMYIFRDVDSDHIKFAVVTRFDDLNDPDYVLNGIAYKIVETGE